MPSNDEHEAQRLPLEIWARIIGYVSLVRPLQDASETLYSVCLVCRDFQKSATPLLYRHPLLLDHGREQSFWRTVSHMPHLWWHVRDIVLGEREWGNVNALRPSPGLVRLGETIESATSSASASSALRWSESFRLTQHVPIGVGASPCALEEVAWWEKTPVGGLLSGHAYSTREQGEWSAPVDRLREQHRRQERARTVEDVDLGRGPGQRIVLPAMRDDNDDNDQGELHTVDGQRGRRAAQGQPTGLDEDDVWAAAERFAAADAQREASTTSSIADHKERLASASSTTAANTAWSIPSTIRSKPRRLPWRYSLVTGHLDPNMAKFFEAIGTLQHIELTLYPGTLLDHDLLEHQLRLLLDPDHMPILERLDVMVGHDSVSIGSRLARITHSKVIQLAVSRVDDPRCRLKAAGRTYGGGKRDSRDDVREDTVVNWLKGVEGEMQPSAAAAAAAAPEGKGRKWRNGWLDRDVQDLNLAIEE